MPTPENFRSSYPDRLTVTVRGVSLRRSVRGSATDITDAIEGTGRLDPHLGLVGTEYPHRKREQGIDLTLVGYESSDALQQEWEREREFYLDSGNNSGWDAQFSDPVQELLKEGRTAANDFHEDPPTVRVYYIPEQNQGPPVVPERWGVYCRTSRSIFTGLTEDIRSGLCVSLEVEIRLNPAFRSYAREGVTLGLLPYSEYGFDSLGWLKGLEWVIESRQSRMRTNRGSGA